ncbi:MAG: hypothetical protein H6742_07775, partial [Alphaproteobacteria bacterium]|nr:hypothetical protein [Alphaproteobacteria bacterium]
MTTPLLIGLLLSTSARAEVPGESAANTDRAAAATGTSADVVPDERAVKGGFTPILLLQTRATRSSVVTTNPFLDGQVVGALGGTNGTTTSPDDRTMVVEQRAAGFLTWAPRVLDGKAALTAAFEIDFGWGDQSYNVGGNKGGGFGADQVNLQTRRLYAAFRPGLGADDDLTVITGLQFLADGVHDPHGATPDQLFRSGGGLSFFGSEAAGIAAFGRHRTAWGELLRYRAGVYSLVENGTALADDATVFALDGQVTPALGLEL